jgi:glycosyltransferase involved in cell wall biosynthesis
MKQKLTLLIDRSSNSVGGMELSFLRHVKFLNESYDVLPITVCLSNDDTNWYGKVEYLNLDDIEVINITLSDTFLGEKNILLYTCLSQYLTDIIIKHNIDAIQVWGVYQLLSFSCAIAARKTNIPLILSFRGSDFNSRIYHSQLTHLWKSIEAANFCTFVNKGAESLFKSMFPNKKSAVIYNFIDQTTFQPTYDRKVSEMINIGCSGNFRRQMGIDILLNSFKEVNSRYPKTHLFLIGDYRESEKSYFKMLIEESPAKDFITLTGIQEHNKVAELISDCDIMVYPSISEGCPNKILEGMFAKKAIVASDVDGINDLIINNENGLLVPFSDIDKFTSKIIELIDSPQKRIALGNSAYQRIINLFTKEISLENWLKVYSEVLCI